MAKKKEIVEEVEETVEAVEVVEDIDIALLTVESKGDSEQKKALKAVYVSYYEQNPERANNNVEKANLLTQLNKL